MTKIDEDIPGDNEVYLEGETAILELTITESGERKDLSEADILFVLSRFRGEDALIEKTLNDGITIISGEVGVVQISVDPDETRRLGGPEGEEYQYEVRVRDAGSSVATVTTGTWTIHSSTARLD